MVLAGALDSAAETIRVDIAQLAFAPAQVSAHVGDSIEWVSTDFVAHTATARNKEWDITIPPKGTGSVVLKSGGVIDYYCRFHPNMKGSITVEDRPR
jgi:plastocyanin